MAEKIVIARHRQVCDLCHGHIEAGERCRLIRDDFWPLMTWFEHIRCPHDMAVAAEPVHPNPPRIKMQLAFVH
ncbi:MAG: hypothetical protein ACOX6W_02720 [Lentisphaeria bacterium]|jgi:hypothetical protein